jgi:hypothetical protein
MNDADVPDAKSPGAAAGENLEEEAQEGRVTAGLSPVSTSHRTRCERKALYPHVFSAARAH